MPEQSEGGLFFELLFSALKDYGLAGQQMR